MKAELKMFSILQILIQKQQLDLLEKIAGYSKAEARDLVLKRVEEMMNLEIAAYIKDRESEAKLEVDRKAKNMLVEGMQKYAGQISGRGSGKIEKGAGRFPESGLHPDGQVHGRPVDGGVV